MFNTKELFENLYFHSWSRLIVTAKGSEKSLGTFFEEKLMTLSYPEPSTRRIDSDAEVVMRDDDEGPWRYNAKETSLFTEKIFGTIASFELKEERASAGKTPEVLNTSQADAL